MKTKIIQIVPATLSVLLIAFSYFGFACAESNQCFASSFFWDATFTFLEPLQIYMWVVFIPAAVVIFVKKEFFDSWLRLAAWLVPVSLLIIFITPVTSNSWMPLYFVSREEMAWYLGLLLAATSLLLVLWKWFSARRFGQP